MDAALALKMSIDRGVTVTTDQALDQLSQSPLVQRLTDGLVEKPLFYVWRLICLSEIPYSVHLDYTKHLLDRVQERLVAPFGFSLSGDEKEFLPCYNAMLVSAMCRLGLAKQKSVRNGVDWIVRYQPMTRGVTVSVPDMRFDRFGGCFKQVPCYIGLAKSVFALFDYHLATGDDGVKQKLAQGIDYLLQHGLINRLHSDKPITDHILAISFPETYRLNIVELVRFAARADLLSDPRTHQAVAYLENRKIENTGWNISYRYRAEGYTVFDKGRGAGDWVSYILSRALACAE